MLLIKTKIDIIQSKSSKLINNQIKEINKFKFE